MNYINLNMTEEFCNIPVQRCKPTLHNIKGPLYPYISYNHALSSPHNSTQNRSRILAFVLSLLSKLVKELLILVLCLVQYITEGGSDPLIFRVTAESDNIILIYIGLNV